MAFELDSGLLQQYGNPPKSDFIGNALSSFGQVQEYGLKDAANRRAERALTLDEEKGARDAEKREYEISQRERLRQEEIDEAKRKKDDQIIEQEAHDQDLLVSKQQIENNKQQLATLKLEHRLAIEKEKKYYKSKEQGEAYVELTAGMVRSPEWENLTEAGKASKMLEVATSPEWIGKISTEDTKALMDKAFSDDALKADMALQKELTTYSVRAAINGNNPVALEGFRKLTGDKSILKVEHIPGNAEDKDPIKRLGQIRYHYGNPGTTEIFTKDRPVAMLTTDNTDYLLQITTNMDQQLERGEQKRQQQVHENSMAVIERNIELGKYISAPTTPEEQKQSLDWVSANAPDTFKGMNRTDQNNLAIRVDKAQKALVASMGEGANFNHEDMMGEALTMAVGLGTQIDNKGLEGGEQWWNTMIEWGTNKLLENTIGSDLPAASEKVVNPSVPGGGGEPDGGAPIDKTTDGAAVLEQLDWLIEQRDVNGQQKNKTDEELLAQAEEYVRKNRN